MREADLRKIVSDGKELDRRIRQQEGFFRKTTGIPDRAEMEGHIEKALWNLEFVSDNLRLGYYDWCLTGCYYACYHAALALLLAKGISTKSHEATIIFLAKAYYRTGLEEKEISLVNSLFLGYSELLFYVGARNQREKASYASRTLFSKALAEEYRKKSIGFVVKARRILRLS
ncbi:MAG: HEPN domain-containing protein [archaeon]